jgi:hypothetical protein
MRHNQSILWMFFWIALTAALLMGCGAKGQPAEFEQTAGEMKEGPGVFTGEEGEFTIFDSKKGGPFWKQQQDKSEEASKEGEKEAQAASDKPAETTPKAADQTTREDQVTPEEAKEFQEFQEWKKEQQSFKAFQEWKNSAEGKAEYQEFLEWKEWKAYKEWKKQQKE